MKKSLLLAAAFVMVFGFGVHGVMAGGPGTIIYDKARNGAVTFDHKAHADLVDCAKCHEGGPGPIEVTRDGAHGATCKDCHVESSGPAKCGECHIRG